jgi:hypothetical protein
MVEIPEHLRKRAEEARAKAEAARGGGDGGTDADDAGGADLAEGAAHDPQDTEGLRL